MGVEIVPMQLHVVPQCAAILSSTPLWRDVYGVTYDRAVRLFTDGLADSYQTFLVAQMNGKVVGLADYVKHGAFFFGSYLRLLAVHADYRSQGIGAQLLSQVEAVVHKSTPNMFLLATQENTEAHRFYIKMGYKHVGTLPDFVVKGVTECIFWKRLMSEYI